MTAPPGFSQPAAPLSLPAPRHPPHALTSLAAPPPPPGSPGKYGGGVFHSPRHTDLPAAGVGRMSFRSQGLGHHRHCPDTHFTRVRPRARPARHRPGSPRADAAPDTPAAGHASHTTLPKTAAFRPATHPFRAGRSSLRPLDQPLSGQSISRLRSTLYWRLVGQSTGREVFLSRPRPAAPTGRQHRSSRRPAGLDPARPFPGVEKTGLEPATSCLQSRRSTS